MPVDGIYDEESLKEKGRKNIVKILTEMKMNGNDHQAFQRLRVTDLQEIIDKSTSLYEALCDIYLLGYHQGMTAEKNRNKKKRQSS